MSSTANQANTALPLHPAPDHGDRPRAEAGAARALDHTNSWKPPLDRRQSWSKEDHKHALQMSGLGAGAGPGPGFSEKPA